MTLLGIAENICADLILVVLGIVLGYIFFVFTKRRRLLRFYGIHESRRIVIYLSNLRVIRFGAVGIDGCPRSFQGSAAALEEMEVANRFGDLFNFFLPSLAEKSGLLSKLLISDVQVQILLSPLDPELVERSSSFITLGSPAFNAVSDFAETGLNSQVKFEPPSVQVPSEAKPGTVQSAFPDPDSKMAYGAASEVPLAEEQRDSQAWHRLTFSAMSVKGVPPITDPTCGFVERVVDHEQRRCAFYAAGRSALGTAGAAYFLITEWERLSRKYGSDAPFVVMLRFEGSDYKRWSILFEK